MTQTTVAPPPAGRRAGGSRLRGVDWTTFAETGAPGGSPAWPPFSAASDRRIQFATTVSTLDNFRADQCAFWRTVYDEMSLLPSP